MKRGRIRLFINPPCGWCRQAKEWREVRGIQNETLDATVDAAARQEMLERSGQRLVPVIEVGRPGPGGLRRRSASRIWEHIKNEETAIVHLKRALPHKAKL